MRANLIDAAARRWVLRAALFLGLIAMIAALATTVDAQGNQPKTPHWFWGTDADAYTEATIQAVNQNGTVVETATIDSDGGWSVVVSPEDAAQVKLRIVSASGDRETALMDVIVGGFDPDGLSIAEFQVVDDTDDLDNLADDSETLTVKIRARVHPEHPDIPYRSIEFNLSVDGEPLPLNDNPRERTIRPNHSSGRWYQSNLFALGDGFEARIIACKDQSGGVRFGVRVEGQDDIIPRLNLLPGSRTTTRWAASNEIDLPLPGNDPNPSRAGRGDTDCLYGK